MNQSSEPQNTFCIWSGLLSVMWQQEPVRFSEHRDDYESLRDWGEVLLLSKVNALARLVSFGSSSLCRAHCVSLQHKSETP